MVSPAPGDAGHGSAALLLDFLQGRVGLLRAGPNVPRLGNQRCDRDVFPTEVLEHLAVAGRRIGVGTKLGGCVVKEDARAGAAGQQARDDGGKVEQGRTPH